MRGALAGLAGALLALAGPSLAAPKPDPYRALQQRDQKLFAAGWRLVTGNAPFCEHTVPALGVLWQDLSTYPDPKAAGRALGALGPVVVQAVADGSPAAAARLSVGDTLYGIGMERHDDELERDGDELSQVRMVPIADIFPVTDPRWKRLAAVQLQMDRIMQRDGEIVLEWQDRQPQIFIKTTFDTVPACATRFEVSGIGERAVADGERVVFGDRFPGFDWPEDEFAAAVAHELAHNLLRHRAWLEGHGRSRANIRLTEDEADRLVPWLMVNAGYDPRAAVRFLRRWGPGHDGGLFRKRTHSGWDERAAAIAAELPLIEAARDGSGKADWRRNFRRTTGS